MKILAGLIALTVLVGCASTAPIPDAPLGADPAAFTRDWLACGGRDRQQYSWLSLVVGLPGQIVSEVIHDRAVQACMEARGWPPRPLEAPAPDPALIDRAHGR